MFEFGVRGITFSSIVFTTTPHDVIICNIEIVLIALLLQWHIMSVKTFQIFSRLTVFQQYAITGINPEAVKWGDDRYDRLLCHGLQPGPPSQNPRGPGPEVLKRERGHVTSETRVADVAVFGALQRNALAYSKGNIRTLSLET